MINLSEVVNGMSENGDKMDMSKDMEGCDPELKASALAKIDEAMGMLDKEGVAYDQAANMIKEHLSVEEEEEPSEDESSSKGASKLAAIMALKKKNGMGADEDLA